MIGLSASGRLALALVALVGAMLCGCNVVVTKSPLFTAADETGAQQLRPGLWRFDSGADCKVDETRPLADWPQCAGGAVLGGGKAGYYERKSGSPVWTLQPLVVAAGTPRIAQTQIVVSGDVKLETNPYGYAGVRPTRLDDQDRIVAIAFWPVQCGPPPAGGEGITVKPLPGIVADKGDPVCTTTSIP